MYRCKFSNQYVLGSNHAPAFAHLAMKISCALATHGHANISEHELTHIFDKETMSILEHIFNRCSI
jgi:hypothetical protein